MGLESLFGGDFLILLALIPLIIIGMRYPVIVLYVMLFLVPLEGVYVSPEGATLTRYSGYILVGVWLMYKLMHHARIGVLFNHRIIKYTLFFLWLCGVAFFWSKPGLWLDWITTLAQILIWMIILLDLIDDRRKLTYALVALILGNVVSVALQLQEYSLYGELIYYRASGGNTDPNFSSSVSVALLPFVFYGLTQAKWYVRIVCLAIIVWFLVGVGVSVSRTGVIGAILVLGLQLLVWMRYRYLRPSYTILLGGALLVVALLLPWDKITYRFAVFESQNIDITQIGYRGALAEIGIQRFVDNPIIGYGLGRDFVLHNLYLEMANQLGIFGLVTMCLLWFVTWQNARFSINYARRINDGAMLALGNAMRLSIIVYAIFSATLSNERVRMLWLTFALAQCIYNVTARKAEATTTTPVPARSGSQGGLVDEPGRNPRLPRDLQLPSGNRWRRTGN
ncbi:MAG: O-antigen ligase family protein [Anaerolineae bacterium]